MLISITFNPSTSTTTTTKLPSALAKISNDEVILIELQGSLEVEVAQPTDKNGKFVGKLTINEDGSGKPTLLIGHHLLEGKITALNKPLAILTRSTADVHFSATASPSSPSEVKGRGKDSGDSKAMEMDEDGVDRNEHTSAATAQPPRWDAVGIVRRKVVFAKRPMPMARLSS